MPEFISRPNFGPASELWNKAITLAANRSNPMIEGVNAGMETLRQGLGSMAQVGAQKDSQAAAAERAKQELYNAHVADMMAKGTLAPIENRVSPAMAPGQGVMAPGPAPTYAGLPSAPMAGAANPAIPDFAATMPEVSRVLPPGSVGTTHDFARALGITPSGPEMAILKPKEKAQTVAITPEMIDNYPNLAKMGYAPGHEMPLSVFQQQTKPVIEKADVVDKNMQREISKAKRSLAEANATVKVTIPEIDRVMKLNENAYGGLGGKAEMKMRSALNIGTDDEKFKNTSDVVNTMKNMVAKVLKSTFGGQLSDSERAYLNEVYGAAEGYSNKERAIAMNNVKTMLIRRQQEQESILSDLGGTMEKPAEKKAGKKDSLGIL